MRIITLLTLLVLSACGPQPQGSSSYTRGGVNPITGETVSQQMARQERAKLPAAVEWAKMVIRTRQRQPLTVDNAQKSLQQFMRDPDSTRFSNVRADRGTGAVCGFYNSKNAYGGYAGERPFVYYHTVNYSSPQLSFPLNQDLELTVMELASAMCPAPAR